MLMAVIEILPIMMNILASKLANTNLPMCFKFKMKALKADEQKESPETAM